MPRGISFHIGLNFVDPTHYDGWDGELKGCENDARDMKAIADSKGFESQIVLTKEGTSDRIIEGIKHAAAELRPGDMFFLTYSGHGGQVPDTNDEEFDQLDETWVLYDRQLVDDELYTLWGSFAEGVRILVLSDSCHSGSNVRGEFYENSPSSAEAPLRFKMLPQEVQSATYKAHKDVYDGIQAANPQGDSAGVGASILLISGCQDNQYSRDGDRNGLFTQRLLETWDDGKYSGAYRSFHKAIADLMPPDQSPNFYRTGIPNRLFERQSPFTI